MISVRVPATSANLGPALDAAAVALTLWNRFDVREAEDWRFDAYGPEAEPLPPVNPFRQAAEAWAALTGRVLTPLHVSVYCGVPMARGLGSSATAIVAGLLAAEELLRVRGDFVTRLRVATAVEGHPDNVAAALLGGIVLAWDDGSASGAVGLSVPPRWRMVIGWPATRLSTRESRAVLPLQVERDDAVFNTTRAALLAAAIAQDRPEWLAEATRDRLHQPYREPLVPGWQAVSRAARAAGAWAVTLSGAGPAILAWCAEETATSVAEAMAGGYRAAGVSATVRVFEIAREGATSVHVPERSPEGQPRGASG